MCKVSYVKLFNHTLVVGILVMLVLLLVQISVSFQGDFLKFSYRKFRYENLSIKN